MEVWKETMEKICMDNKGAMIWLAAILKTSRSEGAEELDLTQMEVVYPVKVSQKNERRAQTERKHLPRAYWVR